MQSIAFPTPERGTARSTNLMEYLLREREQLWRQLYGEQQLNALIGEMLTTSAVALAGYGAVLGFSQSWAQALAAALKLPLLFLLTLAICLPALHVCNLLFGGALSARQTLALGLVAITFTAIFTLAFTPITLFFLVTAQSYHFFVLLNVAILALTGAIGLHFVVAGARRLNALAAMDRTRLEQSRVAESSQAAPQPRLVNVGILPLWLALYGFVGAQLGWTLRPFFGLPDAPFVLFRPLEGSFAMSIIDMLLWLAR